MNQINLLNVSIDNLSQRELLEKLGHEGGVVVTPNLDHLVKLQRDREFYQAYQASHYRVCDSKIVQFASNFLGVPIKEKISGSDLLPAFYNYYRDNKNIKIFLLGAAEGVAEVARKRINQKVGREIVVDVYSPPLGFEKDRKECEKIIALINNSEATVLAMGVGSPKQEKWIAKYKEWFTKIKIFLAIGATIDFEAGVKPRAPKWMSEAGLEWFYRLQCEPQRLWKRYLVDSLPFFWLIMQQKLGLYSDPSYMKRYENLFNLPERYNLPIGQILQQAGLVSRHQIEQILRSQSQYHHHMRFGELISHQGLVRQETVDFFAEKLPNLAMMGQQHPLGEYLKLAKILDDNQIKIILNDQDRTGLRFGEMAVEKGWVKPQTIDFLVNIFAGEL